jgi:hypothetical protein
MGMSRSYHRGKGKPRNQGEELKMGNGVYSKKVHDCAKQIHIYIQCGYGRGHDIDESQ